MPSLIFVGDMAEIFLPERSKAVIDRTLGTLASSDHIGLILTKLPERIGCVHHRAAEITQRLGGRSSGWASARKTKPCLICAGR